MSRSVKGTVALDAVKNMLPEDLFQQLSPYSFAITITVEYSPINWPSTGKHVPPEGSIEVRGQISVLPRVPTTPIVILTIIEILNAHSLDWSIQPLGEESIQFVIGLVSKVLYDQFERR